MSTQKDYVKIPKPISINSMTDAEFDAELEKGYQNIIKGNVVSARQLFKSIKEDYNL